MKNASFSSRNPLNYFPFLPGLLLQVDYIDGQISWAYVFNDMDTLEEASIQEYQIS